MARPRGRSLVNRALKVGTRGSPLALAQTEEVLARLRVAHPDMDAEPVVIETHGDEDYKRDLGTPIDGKRAFAKRIEDALLDGRVDVAVHSLKDLPAMLVDGLVLAAIPLRADPRDLLLANDGFAADRLPRGTRVGTSSLRRRAQLLARWPSLEVVDLHGNVGTRLRRLDAKHVDAIVLAAAGFQRLKVSGRPTEFLSSEVMTPAPGQGALAVEAREEDREVRDLLGSIDDRDSRIATEAERALSRRIGGGCNVPFGALAEVDGGTMTLRAVVASQDGRRIVRTTSGGPLRETEDIVNRVAGNLLDGGAKEILQEIAR